jgi:Holliday junction resolvase
MSNEGIQITKKSGEKALFDEQKLKHSLERAGAGENDIREIVRDVTSKLTEGMSTHKVYQMAYAILRKKSHQVAGKYRLKKAIFQLGPTGFPFERFVGELLKNQGYQVEVGKIVQGHCVKHEVDVVAQKEDKKVMIECKFHRDASRKSDVKVSLYIHSRFLDIEKQWKKNTAVNQRFHQGWIVTNTRFSEDAMQYGKCCGLHLISWDYPAGDSLRDRIDLSGLHPITALQTLKKREKQALLQLGIVLSRDIKRDNLLQIGMRENMIRKVLKEANELTSI